MRPANVAIMCACADWRICHRQAITTLLERQQRGLVQHVVSLPLLSNKAGARGGLRLEDHPARLRFDPALVATQGARPEDTGVQVMCGECVEGEVVQLGKRSDRTAPQGEKLSGGLPVSQEEWPQATSRSPPPSHDAVQQGVAVAVEGDPSELLKTSRRGRRWGRPAEDAAPRVAAQGHGPSRRRSSSGDPYPAHDSVGPTPERVMCDTDAEPLVEQLAALNLAEVDPVIVYSKQTLENGDTDVVGQALSNFYPVPEGIWFEGRKYPTTEHAFHAALVAQPVGATVLGGRESWEVARVLGGGRGSGKPVVEF